MTTVAFTDPTRAPERVPFSVVTASLFQTLRSRPLMGRLFAESDGQSDAPPVTVISVRFWRAQLRSEPHVLGRTILIDGTTTTIVGVLPASFAFPASDVRLWVPLSIVSNGYLGGFGSRALARLRPGVTLATAQLELQQILLRISATYPEEAPGLSTASVLAKTRAIAVVRPMRDDAVGDFARIMWLVVATVSVLILVAFSNVASLALARAEARQREFAIRTTLGASRARVWWNLVTESAIVSIIGGLAGVGLGLVILAWLARLGPTSLPDPNMAGDGLVRIPRLNEIGVDAVFLLSAAALSIAFLCVGAAIGMWRLAGTAVARSLHDAGRHSSVGKATRRMRSAFVGAEVALSLVLLSGSAVLGRSVLRLRAIHPGFDAAGTLTFWTSPSPATYPKGTDISRFYREALDAIHRVPGVESAVIVSKLPLAGWRGETPIAVEDAQRAGGEMPPPIAVAGASSG